MKKLLFLNLFMTYIIKFEDFKRNDLILMYFKFQHKLHLQGVIHLWNPQNSDPFFLWKCKQDLQFSIISKLSSKRTEITQGDL